MKIGGGEGPFLEKGALAPSKTSPTPPKDICNGPQQEP